MNGYWIQPLTATNSQLIQHGYPIPPSSTSSDAYQEWLTAVNSIRTSHPNSIGTDTSFFSRRHSPKANESNVYGAFTGWTGYYDTDSNSYNLTESTFKVPSVSGSSGEATCSWVGIGGTGGSNLFQAGIVQHMTTGVPEQYAFYEYVGADGQTDTIPSKDLGTVYTGDTIYAEVYYEGSNKYYYDVVDETQGTSWANSVTPGWSTSDLTSADFIQEAPQDGSGDYYTLPDFGNVQFSGCYADNNGTQGAGGNWSNTLIDMSETDPNGNPWPYSAASSWNSGGTSFTVYYHS
ncbi:G1 family glutamic endopeptidase [Alicyclobacillus fastidiosus]|uniref:G1 family glutamic endopeptidase n=1 Tax=Alicyclobacillus fastidiosus TaxID=392011 RepID=UPI0032AEFCBD